MVYTVKGDETGWGKRHGYLRGWMKTNEKGGHKFFTLMPNPLLSQQFFIN
jgi:protocatechuate 3,4-dioxygenase, beta subunit